MAYFCRPGMTRGEELWSHFRSLDTSGDGHADSAELLQHLERGGEAGGASQLRQLCLDALVEEGDRNRPYIINHITVHLIAAHNAALQCFNVWTGLQEFWLATEFPRVPSSPLSLLQTIRKTWVPDPEVVFLPEIGNIEGNSSDELFLTDHSNSSSGQGWGKISRETIQSRHYQTNVFSTMK